jgi:hypothetical protein
MRNYIKAKSIDMSNFSKTRICELVATANVSILFTKVESLFYSARG